MPKVAVLFTKQTLSSVCTAELLPHVGGIRSDAIDFRQAGLDAPDYPALQFIHSNPMCFSATASFAAGAFLLGAGAISLRLAESGPECFYAAIPLLFALQQASEGILWLSFGWNAPGITFWSTQLFSFFSHVLWPVYVPVAALLVEPAAFRRRLLVLICAAGVGVGSWLLYSMFAYPIEAAPIGGHIEYVSPHFFAGMSMALYLLATAVSLMVSSQRWIQLFGALALLSSMLAYAFYARWFISVWCFFAAVLSLVVVMHLLERRRAAELRGRLCA